MATTLERFYYGYARPSDRFCRSKRANLKTVPIPQRRPQEAIERGALGFRKRQKACDERRYDDLGSTAGAVIALNGDTEPLYRQCAAVHAFGAGFDEDARTEELHDIGAEPAGAADVPGILRAGVPQPRCSAGAFG
jgi:hypothetical protein